MDPLCIPNFRRNGRESADAAGQDAVLAQIRAIAHAAREPGPLPEAVRPFERGALPDLVAPIEPDDTVELPFQGQISPSSPDRGGQVSPDLGEDGLHSYSKGLAQ
jgi:hypothetical protein